MAKTVYLGMIGDIMHPGYINIINKATEYGDVIIGLFTDKAIANHRRLPYLDGHAYSIAVFVKDSEENNQENSKIIADISRIVYEYVTHQ